MTEPELRHHLYEVMNRLMYNFETTGVTEEFCPDDETPEISRGWYSIAGRVAEFYPATTIVMYLADGARVTIEVDENGMFPGSQN